MTCAVLTSSILVSLQERDGVGCGAAKGESKRCDFEIQTLQLLHLA